jgi:hypothetical protein
MDTFFSYISHSLFLLTLGAALGSILLAGFVKSCSCFGLLPVREDAGQWHQLLKSLE